MEKTPRGVGWRVGVLGLAIIYAGIAAIVIIDGMTPSGYKGAHLPPGAVWLYPWDDVQFSLTAMTIELAISALYLWVRAETGIWLRATLLAVLQFFAMFLFGVMAMHATRPFIDHLVYLFFACCYLILFAIGSKVAAISVQRRKAKSLDLKAFD
jgi:lysylphosphatidylglycerol synthetase-like protein (DUF2156 family)